MIAAWPRRDEGWCRHRVVAAAAAVALASLSKETWVATPALVAALELGQRRVTPRRALPATALATAAVLVYVPLYFALFPGDKGYYRISLAPLAKLPHEFAAFLHLEGLLPVGFTFTWRGALAIAVVAGLTAFGLKKSRAATTVGLALLIAPTIPTLLVPYLPTRYTSIPYAGFLLLAAAAIEVGLRGAPARWRPAAVAGVGGAGRRGLSLRAPSLCTPTSATTPVSRPRTGDSYAKLPPSRPPSLSTGRSWSCAARTTTPPGTS